MIIDIHTHPHGGRETWPRFVAECRRYGVTMPVISCLSPGGSLQHFPPPREVTAGNAWAEQFCAQTDLPTRWLAYLNPQNDNSLEELDRCLARGAAGIKLWTAFKRNGSGVERSYPILAAAEQKGIPVLIHTWHKTDGNEAGELCVREFAELARRFPRACLIAAHAGGNWPYGRGALAGLPNAYWDISGFFPERGQVEALVEDVGADHILFGSDMPGRSVISQLAKVVFAQIDADQKEQILWRNAARLLKLQLPAQPGGPPALRPEPEENGLLRGQDTDHFCFCGRAPVLDHACPSARELEAILARHGIKTAYAAGSDSLYTRDTAGANAALRAAAAGCTRVVPLATLDPSVPGWAQSLEHARRAFAGGIVFPYLHNWRLNDPAGQPFWNACAEARFPLWINGCTGDHRARHRGLACRPVGVEELLDFGRRAPPNHYVFQGLGRAHVDAFLSNGQGPAETLFEMSRLTDYTAHLETIIERYGPGRLVLGSEFPLRDIRTVRWTAQHQCAASQPQ